MTRNNLLPLCLIRSTRLSNSRAYFLLLRPSWSLQWGHDALLWYHSSAHSTHATKRSQQPAYAMSWAVMTFGQIVHLKVATKARFKSYNLLQYFVFLSMESSISFRELDCCLCIQQSMASQRNALVCFLPACSLPLSSRVLPSCIPPLFRHISSWFLFLRILNLV